MDARVQNIGKNRGALFLGCTFLLIVAFFSIVNNVFFSFANFLDILMRVAVIAPVAIGIMGCLIVKGIDLSSGTIIGLIGIILARMMKSAYPLWIGIVIVLVIGVLIGIINSILIAKLYMNPFVATLAVMFVGLSMEKVLTQGGLPVYLYGDKSGLSLIYRGILYGIPYPIYFLLILILIAFFVFEKTIFGRRLRASGESIRGATNAGINVKFYYGSAYILSALFASISGIIVASQVQSGQPMVGQSYLWDAIGAAYLSTTLSRTRTPNVVGTVAGTIFLSMVNNGLTILGVPFYWKTFFSGVLILFILLTSVINQRYTVKVAR